MKKIGKHKLYLGDCLEKMKHIEDNSVDMVLCDLPYGTTACKWDVVLPFDQLWRLYRRVCTKTCVFVMFGVQPFTSEMIQSNRKGFKHAWVWNKRSAANGPVARYQPLKVHGDIVIFSNSAGSIYNPQGTVACNKTNYRSNTTIGPSGKHSYTQTTTNFPKSILEFSNAARNIKVHPTQKPVDLLEYLIKTYSNKGMLVLDNTMGSGSTGVACVNTGRKFVGIEKDKGYYRIAKSRLREALEHQKQSR